MNSDALRALAAEHWDLDTDSTTAKALVGYEDLNLRLVHTSGRTYILKVAPPGTDRAALVLQHRVLRHLGRNAPELPVPKICTTLDGDDFIVAEGDGGKPRLIRLLTHLPGRRMDCDSHPAP